MDSKLPEQLQQALLLIQHAFAAVAIINEQGHLEWANDSFFTLFGCESSSLSEHTLWQLLPPSPLIQRQICPPRLA
ncbi:PAS domain-containing protein [Hymenobacter sp. HDW8]|nr:PAS domain-containing protein [Hymenobacter sp. HDW8]